MAAFRTVVEVWRELQGVDELGVETRGHLDAHTAEEQPDVHAPQIGLLVPWRLVLGDEAGDDGVGGAANVDHLGELSTFSSTCSSPSLAGLLLSSWFMQEGAGSGLVWLGIRSTGSAEEPTT